jgi:glycerol-3-phosphate acyltransferase PlsX
MLAEVSERAPIRIALDGMGGDHAPAVAVEAAAAITRETKIEIALVGRPDELRAELRRHEHDPARIEIVAAREVVGMDEKPKEALAAKPDASIAVAARLVAAGDAAALVSAGSTGALVLACATHIPRIEGVERAALAAVYPTRQRQGGSSDRFALMLDVGATVRCRPRDLMFFAYMGHAYASRISKVARPTIALLNMGTEPTKGGPELVQAHAWMSADPMLNFVGNVEGCDIPTGGADVIVCEGFVGNVALKMAEGVSEVFRGLGRWAFKQNLLWKAGLVLLSGGLRQLKHLTDYSEYGGAPLLGLRHPVIKAHGKSHPRAIANAVKVAAKAARDGVSDEIREAVAAFEAREGDDRVARGDA